MVRRSYNEPVTLQVNEWVVKALGLLYQRWWETHRGQTDSSVSSSTLWRSRGMQEVSDSPVLCLAVPLPIVPLLLITLATPSQRKEGHHSAGGGGLVHPLSSYNWLTKGPLMVNTLLMAPWMFNPEQTTHCFSGVESQDKDVGRMFQPPLRIQWIILLCYHEPAWVRTCTDLSVKSFNNFPLYHREIIKWLNTKIYLNQPFKIIHTVIIYWGWSQLQTIWMLRIY